MLSVIGMNCNTRQPSLPHGGLTAIVRFLV